MDRSALGLAAIGVLECFALIAFAVSPPPHGGGATPNHKTASSAVEDLKSRVSSDNVDGGIAMDDGPAGPQAMLSICADVNAGFICAP